MTTRSIFIVAAPALLASLAEQFAALEGFSQRAADSTAQLRDLAAHWSDAERPDAILLDAAFCAGDTAATIAALRREGFAGAMVVIADSDARHPGAATLPRPFRFADLLALIDAGATGAAQPPATHVRLTEKETAIYARLAQANGGTVSKAALLAEVWGYGPNVSTRTLETHIHRLRRKIESDPARPRRLLTDGGGYRLAPPKEGESATVLLAP